MLYKDIDIGYITLKTRLVMCYIKSRAKYALVVVTENALKVLFFFFIEYGTSFEILVIF